MHRTLRIPILILAFNLQTASVFAQVAGPCCIAPPPVQPQSGKIVASQSMPQATLLKSRTISRIVGERLAPAPGPAIPPLPRAYAETAETSDPAAWALTADGDDASLAASDPAMNWNVWFDSSVLYTDRDNPVSGYDGALIVASLGLDRKIGDKSVIGLLVNYEYVDFDTTSLFGAFTVPGKLKSRGLGIGAYAGSAITDNIVADALVVWSRIENDVVELTIPGDFESDRIQAAANLTGYWYVDAWRFSPAVGIAWSRENQDSYSNPFFATPSNTLESGIAIAGVQVGRTMFLDDVRTIEPWIGLSAEWEFHSAGTTPGTELDAFDLRVLGGLNTQLGQSVSASIRADIAGIARSDYITATVGGQIAVRF